MISNDAITSATMRASNFLLQVVDKPVETNALNAKIKDLAERTDVLRGYL